MGNVGKYYKIVWYPNIKQGRIIKYYFNPNKAHCQDDFCKDLLPVQDPDTVNIADDFNDRLSQSISRTKSRIFELAGCNPWDWFFTGTLNPDWHDTNNLGGFRKALSQYIRDCRKQYKTPCAYLLIPEQHKSGAWHVHGLLYGFPDIAFRRFTLSETLPYKLLEQLRRGDDIRQWVGYSNKFGYTTVSPIRSQERTTSYITKYVTKDCVKSSISNGNHLFYASQGLQGKITAYEGKQLPLDLGKVVYSFENEYVSISDIDTLPPSVTAKLSL